MKNGTLTLEIESLAHDGRGIGFLPQPGQKRGLAVFVERALPGETIICELQRRAANYAEAAKRETVASSFAPQAPHCPRQSQCGGCPLQPLPYAAQLGYKEKLVLDAMGRIGGFAPAVLARAWQGLSPSPLTRAFRRKITLAFGRTEAGTPALGFRKAASHAIVPFASCAMVDAGAWPIIAQLRELALNADAPALKDGFWRSATLRLAAIADNAAPAWHLLLRTSPGGRAARKHVAALGERLLGDQPELAAFVHEETSGASGQARRVRALAPTGKAGHMLLNLGGRQFGLDIASFFQVNIQASQLLAEAVARLDQAAAGPLLDLFCGIGAPGLLLAGRHESCLGIERDAAAVKWARRNAAGLERWQYQCGNVARVMRKLAAGAKSGTFGTALLDPPRAGLGRAAVADLVRLAPGHVIYVSCDTATLARDAAGLAPAYSLESFGAVDMFPHTPHVECFSLWKRLDRAGSPE